MSRLARCLLAAIIIIALPMLSQAATAQDRLPATVTSIVDGDTIRMQPVGGSILTVRLTGIDTPETKHPSKPVQCYGMEASANTAELLPVGTRVELEMDVEEQDRYGRTLA